MEIQGMKSLVKMIKESDDKQAEQLILGYGNTRASQAIERSWDKTRRYLSFVLNNRKKRIGAHLIDFDNPNKVVGITSFTKYFALVEDEIIFQWKSGNRETREALKIVQNTMYNSLQGIKIDRRRLAKKE